MSPAEPPGTRARSALRAVVVAVQLIALAGVVALAVGFVVFVQSLDGRETEPARRAEGIVVLTGGADRVADALSLLLDSRGERLLISGVNPSASGLDLTRAAPQARRLLACCIELGYAAGNTIGNARETRAWVRRHHLRSLIVVTSDYHMPRALAELADAVPELSLIPHPVVSAEAAGWSDGQSLRLLVTEYIKYIAVLARTRLLPSAPYETEAA